MNSLQVVVNSTIMREILAENGAAFKVWVIYPNASIKHPNAHALAT